MRRIPATGIVRHLDDQCIGCSYCILKCPYDVPNIQRAPWHRPRWRHVSQSALAAGEAPACVQACPTHAIRVVTVISSINRGGRPRPTRPLVLAARPPAGALPVRRRCISPEARCRPPLGGGPGPPAAAAAALAPGLMLTDAAGREALRRGSRAAGRPSRRPAAGALGATAPASGFLASLSAGVGPGELLLSLLHLGRPAAGLADRFSGWAPVVAQPRGHALRRRLSLAAGPALCLRPANTSRPGGYATRGCARPFPARSWFMRTRRREFWRPYTGSRHRRPMDFAWFTSAQPRASRRARARPAPRPAGRHRA